MRSRLLRRWGRKSFLPWKRFRFGTVSVRVQNIFVALPDSSGEEHFLTLLNNSAVEIQRIVSDVHKGSSQVWYDQDHDEWVIVLRGNAVLEFAGGELIQLKTGDYITIPRGVKHRVEYTAPQTIWLVVHVKDSKATNGGRR
jgi:cupin 2 domain-containing protein